MSFTDQQPFVVTDKHTKLHWGGGFWCKLCGYHFREGDTVRWVFAGNKGVVNFFVCEACDSTDSNALIEKAKWEYRKAVELAKRWDIFGPDWQRDRDR